MSIPLRILLCLGAVFTFFYMSRQIRKNKLLLSHTVFWTVFSIGLIILAIFPGIATWTANMIGIESPANFVYLMVIFLLILKEFSSTLKISVLENKLTELTEHIALAEKTQTNKEAD